MSAHDLVAAASGEFPAFQSQKGEALRQIIEVVPIKGLLLELIASAELIADDEWLVWLDEFAAEAFVNDTDFLARWLRHEIKANQPESAKALHSVLKSLVGVSAQVDNAFAAEALAYYCYFADDIAEGDKWAARSNKPAFTTDRFALQFERLKSHHRVNPITLLVDETLIVAEYCGDDRDRVMSVVDFLVNHYLYEELVLFVNKAGGCKHFNGEYPAYLYFSCLEIMGELPRCLAEIQTYLTNYPKDYPVYAILRSIAHKLDRHDVSHAKVSALPARESSPDEVWELLGFDALDQDDYENARICLENILARKSESYLRLQLACETTIPKARHAQRAYREYRASNVSHVGPELQYASQLFNDARSQKDLNHALAIVEPHAEVGSGNVWYIRLLVQLYVSVGKYAEARAFYGALPVRLRSCHALKDIRAYLEQRHGNELACRSLWSEMISGRSCRAITSKSSPPQTVWFRHDPKRDHILVFVCVYNAMEYLEWFLAHYRELGVDHFMIVDNGSTDYTDQYLAQQADVSLFSQPGSFKDSAHGVAWINHLIQKYAQDKWSFFVDIDEAFIFPGQSEGRSLHDLLAEADGNQQRCFPSYMLDLFATKASAKQPGFEGHCYFDNDYHIFPSIVPPYLRVQGGVRARLTGRQFLITKSPLVKPDKSFRFTENNHTHTHLKPSPCLTALLHYKFIGKVADRVEEAIERKQHFMAGRFYKDMQQSMNATGIRRSLASRKFKDTTQLEKLGLLRSHLDY